MTGRRPNNGQIVPNSLYRSFCFPQKITVPANCTAEPGGDESLDLHYVSEARFNQGRCFLPGAMGLPMLAAHILARRTLTAEHMRAMTRLFRRGSAADSAGVPCVHDDSSAVWEVSLNPFKGSWMPPYGAVLPLVCGTLGIIVLFVIYWCASRIPTDPQAAVDAGTGPADAVTEPAEAVSV
jgi:hypothetical protein